MSAQKQLIDVENRDLIPAELFKQGGLEKVLSEIEEAARSLVPVVDTAKGRRDIASMAAKIPRSKTYLDNLGKQLTADLKKQTGIVDAERRGMRDRLDKLKAEVRQPLTAWEYGEKARVGLIRAKIEKIRSRGYEETANHHTAEYWSAQLKALGQVNIGDSFQEWTEEGTKILDETLAIVTLKLNARTLYEAEQAELARLREEAEQVEREKVAAAAKLAREEREKAIKEKAAKEARIKAELAHEAEMARMEASRRQAEQRAYAAENERAAAEVKKEPDEPAAPKIKPDFSTRLPDMPEANKRYSMDRRKEVEYQAAKKLELFGLDEAQAKTIIVAIRLRQIPNVFLDYGGNH